MFKQYVMIFLFSLSLVGKVNAQPMNEVQLPLNWSEEEVVIDLSLYDHVEEGTALVDTQIPDRRSAQLYVVSEFALFPDIKSVLYVSEDKVVMVSYAHSGEYIDHRIIAVANRYSPEVPTYALMNTEEKIITIYSYSNFYSEYEETPVQLQADGHFNEILYEGDSALNVSEVIALMGCSFYGLDGMYPLHEEWLLVAPYEQAVLPVNTLRYGRDFIGNLITLIDEPYEERSDDAINYLLAFKGLDAEVNVEFYAPQDIAVERLLDLVDSLEDKVFFDDYWQPDEIFEQYANTVFIDDELQFVFARHSYDHGVLFAHRNGETISVLYVSQYYLFKLGDQMYLMTLIIGEGSNYDVYEINGTHFNHVAEFGIACC